VKPRAVAGVFSLVLAAGLFVAGCSSLPSSSNVTAPVGPDPASVDTTEAPAPAPTFSKTAVSVSRSVYLRAALGGIVKAGNFSVIVPPLALPDDAIVTVRQPDVTKPVVELSVTPEDRNAFRLPVILVADVSPMDSPLVAVSYLSWWNPVAAKWEPVSGSQVSVVGLTVQAPLMHFSTYRVESNGKAGW
jgi:hypothetical protein